MALEQLLELEIFQKCPDNQITLNSKNQKTIELILSAVAPFLCCYYQVASIVAEKLLDRTFKEKDVFVEVQKHVEHLILTQKIQNTHPYCLSLDSIIMTLLSLCNLKCLVKEKQ